MLLSITKEDKDLARKLCAYNESYDKKDYENLIVLEVVKRYIENNLNVEVTDGLYKLDLDTKPDLFIEGSRLYLDGIRRKGLKLVASIKDSKNVEFLGYKKDGNLIEIVSLKDDIEDYEADLIDDEDAIYEMIVRYQDGDTELRKKVSDALVKFPFLKSEYFSLLCVNKAALNINALEIPIEDNTLDIFTQEFEMETSEPVSIDVTGDRNTIDEYDEAFKEDEVLILEEISEGEVLIEKREEQLEEIDDIEELDDMLPMLEVDAEPDLLLEDDSEDILLLEEAQESDILIEDVEALQEDSVEELMEIEEESELFELNEEVLDISQEELVEEENETILIEEEPLLEIEQEEELEESMDEFDFNEDILDIEEEQEDVLSINNQEIELEENPESQEDVLNSIEEDFDEEHKESMNPMMIEQESVPLQEESTPQEAEIDDKYKGVVDPELLKILSEDDEVQDTYEEETQDVEIKPIKQKQASKKSILPTIVLLGAICAGGFYAYKNKDVLEEKATSFISNVSTKTNKVVKKAHLPKKPVPVKKVQIAPDVKKEIQEKEVKTIELKKKEEALKTEKQNIAKKEENPVIPVVKKEIPKVEPIKELPMVAEIPKEKKVFKSIAKNVNKPVVKKKKTIDEVIAKGFDPSASAVVVQKVSWEIPQSLSDNYSMKKYLIMTGKAVKMNLSQDLLFANDMVTNSRIKLKVKFNSSGSSSEIVLRNSSGSSQVDALILQSVKETISYTKVPDINTNKGLISLNLIINL